MIGLSYGTYIVIKNLPEEKLPPPPVDTSQFTVQAPPVEEDVPPPPPEEPPPPMEKTVEFHDQFRCCRRTVCSFKDRCYFFTQVVRTEISKCTVHPAQTGS